MQALHDVVQAGKARYIGATACTPGISQGAVQRGRAPRLEPGSTRLQNHDNLIYREEERADDPTRPGTGSRGDPVEPAGPRACSPGTGAGTANGTRCGRARTRFGDTLYNAADGL